MFLRVFNDKGILFNHFGNFLDKLAFLLLFKKIFLRLYLLYVYFM